MIESIKVKQNFKENRINPQNSLKPINKIILDLEVESKQLLNDLNNFKFHLDELFQVFFSHISEDDLLDNLYFFTELMQCLIIEPKDYKQNPTGKEKREIQKQNKQNKLKNRQKLTVSVRKRSLIFQEKYLKSKMSNPRDFEELSMSRINSINKKRINLLELVHELNSLEDLKILIGICLLYHFKKLNLDYNKKINTWEVIINEL